MANLIYDTKDPTNLLWDEIYQVTVPTIAIETENDYKLYGKRLTGIDAIDNETSMRLVPVYWNIDRMISAWSDGYPIYVNEYEDIKVIYASCQEYLEIFKDHLLSFGLNAAKAPYDDLILIDDFADMLYEFIGQDEVSNMKLLTPLDRLIKPDNIITDILNSSAIKVKKKQDKGNKSKNTKDKDTIREVQGRISYKDYFIKRTVGKR